MINQETIRQKRDAILEIARRYGAHDIRDPLRLGWQPPVAVEHYHVSVSAIIRAEQ